MGRSKSSRRRLRSSAAFTHNTSFGRSQLAITQGLRFRMEFQDKEGREVASEGPYGRCSRTRPYNGCISQQRRGGARRLHGPDHRARDMADGRSRSAPPRGAQRAAPWTKASSAGICSEKGCSSAAPVALRWSHGLTRTGGISPTRSTGATDATATQSSCSMPPLDRASIDTAVYEYFERVALDVEATRAHVAESRDRKLKEVRALLAQSREGGAQRQPRP